MNDNKNQNTEQPYIVEKIVQPKGHSKRYLYNFIFGAIGSVLFGILACFAFVMVYPYMNQYLHSVKNDPEETITLPKHTEPPDQNMPNESSSVIVGETELTTSGFADNETNSGLNPSAKNWIRDQLNKLKQELSPNIKDLQTYTKEVTNLYSKVERSLVTVSAAEDTQGMFTNTKSLSGGIVFALMPEKKKVYILTDFDVIKLKDIRVMFHGMDEYFEAEITGYDSILGVCVLTVEFLDEQEEKYENIKAIEIGNAYLVHKGSFVMAVGSPFAMTGTMGYGMVVNVMRDQTVYDTQYRMFYTDIVAPQTGKGFLINLDGQLIGIINQTYRDEVCKDYISAIGMDEISDFINHMANGTTYSYLGVKGVAITQTMAEQGKLKQGIYVLDVHSGSPAYEAGIMNGDIITAISTVSVTKVSQLQDALVNHHLPGESVIITVMRQGKTEYKNIEITVKLGVRR